MSTTVPVDNRRLPGVQSYTHTPNLWHNEGVPARANAGDVTNHFRGVIDMSQPTWKTVGMPAIGTYDDDPVTIGEVIAAESDAQNGITDIRYLKVRGGKREKLPSQMWKAIYHRDKSKLCDLCGMPFNRTQPKDMEVDHIIPWSAGGNNLSYNLRLTHKQCNQSRSNFHHSSDTTIKTPVTFSCLVCDPQVVPLRGKMFPAFCGTCRRPSYTKIEWIR